jgi:16S rRNA (uracil1498-N3)-methyltransferase
MRFFYDGEFSDQILLTGQEAHHAAKVMRVRIGDNIEIANGRGSFAKAVVAHVGRDVTLNIKDVQTRPEPSPKIILAAAFIKPSSMEWMVEKATELGASEFWLFPGDGSEKKEVSPHALERLHLITISALKQCGRLYLPKITIKPPLTKWSRPQEQLFFGDVSEAAKPLPKIDKPSIFVVGPEKGFSEKETDYLKSAIGVKLHDNILRAETASLAFLARRNPIDHHHVSPATDTKR